MSRSRYAGPDTRSSPGRWWVWGTTFFWVAVATILVWIHADMEFTRIDNVTVNVRLHTESSPNLVLLSKPTADPEAAVISDIKTEVAFELRGNRSDLDSFVGRHHNASFEYDLSRALGPGDNQQIAAIKVVSKEFRDDIEQFGLSLRSATAIEGIHIDQRVRRKVPVVFDYIGAELVEEPKLTMGVWARRAQWEKIKRALAESGGRAELRTVKKNLKGAEKGKPIDVSAEIIRNIADVPVEPEQTTIPVRIEIRELTDKKTIQVTVRFVIPYTWLEDGTWDQYKLTREKQQTTWVKEIEVTGTREDLARLNPMDVDAYVVLTEDDKKPGSWWTRQVKFRFPPDLKVQLTGKPPEVKFKLEPRKGGITPVPPPP